MSTREGVSLSHDRFFLGPATQARAGLDVVLKIKYLLTKKSVLTCFDHYPEKTHLQIQ